MSSVPRQHWSIGEVLNLLQDEFPEVTISKIRFLEGQGLIDPERTPSGYRRFFPEDFDRLRWVLIQQRDNYLPLRVIRDRIDSGEVTFEPGGEFPDTGPLQRTLGFEESNEAEPADSTTGHTSEPEAASEPAPEAEAEPASAPETEPATSESTTDDPDGQVMAEPEPEDLVPVLAAATHQKRQTVRTPAANVALTKDELATESGCSTSLLNDLERHGLIAGRTVGATVLYDGAALEIAKIGSRFAWHGLDPRHLRSFRIAAEREVGLFAQVVGPQFHRKAPQARQESLEALDELNDLADSLRSILLEQLIADQFPRS